MYPPQYVFCVNIVWLREIIIKMNPHFGKITSRNPFYINYDKDSMIVFKLCQNRSYVTFRDEKLVIYLNSGLKILESNFNGYFIRYAVYLLNTRTYENDSQTNLK